MKSRAFCDWWDKQLPDVTEHEMDVCNDRENYCTECPHLSEKQVEDQDD